MKKKGLPKLIVILGATAIGKTGLAVRLAKEFNGEIVSADSRQIYKEMDIGTSKPTEKEIESVPHHLIDIVYPNQKFNVTIYKKMALKAIKDIQERKKVAFLVGGTGLYIKAVVDNINFPEVSPQKKLRKELETKDEKELFRIYMRLDPKGAKLIEKENKRRLIRAIEVCRITKKPFWEQRNKGKSLFETLQIGIKLSREELKKRISKRTDMIFKLGLEKEVKNLTKKYGGSPLLRTIGYHEWFAEKGEGSIKEKIKLHTLQFAKRQMTWFKRDKRIHWIKNHQEAKEIVKDFLEN
ncbi:MAG: tRNA (adenosine(37)-N6)-dimethylallyltransferase MiaA [Patescibacteria group bacterium]|nr:tRNA (adenosine(37)-N6)-dimethylallyltransferase MiaA [Patescibacteria group bacterium]